MASQIDVVFNADTGRYVANVNAATGAVEKSATAVATAKNKILEAMESQVKKATDLGASQEKLQSITEKAARQMAAVTEDNAKRMIASLDRIAEKQRMVQDELNNLKVPKAAEGSQITDKMRASAVLRGGGIRSAENFASQFELFNKISTIAFPVLGAATLAVEIGRGVAALKEMYDTAQKLPAAMKEGWEDFNAPLMLGVDTLRKTNDELEISIAHLEHKPANNLALALDEDRINADRLAESAAKAFTEVKKLMDENKVGFFSSLLSGQASTGAYSDEINKRMQELRDLQRADRDAIRSGKDTPEAAAQRQATIAGKYQDNANWARKERTDLSSFNQKGAENGNINMLQGFGDYSEDQQDEIEERKRNASDTVAQKQLQEQEKQRKESSEAAKKAAEQQLKNLEAYLNVWKMMAPLSEKAIFDWWEGQKSAFAKGSDQFNAIEAKQAQLAESGANKAHQLMEKLRASLLDRTELPKTHGNVMGNTAETGDQVDRASANAKLADAENNAELERTKIQVAEASGQISKYAADQQRAAIAAKLHADRLKDLNDQMEDLKKDSSYNAVTGIFGSDKAQKQYIELQARIDKESTQQAIEQIQDAAKLAGDTWSGALKNANSEWVQNAQDTAGQVKALFSQTMNGLNDNLSNLMTGKKSNFSEYFRGLGKTVTTDGLEHAEAGILGKFGIEGKPDGSSDKPFYVKMAGDAAGSAKGLAGLFKHKGAGGDAGDDSGDDGDGGDDGDVASGAVGFLSKAAKWVANIFGGGRAVGGDVSSGTTYLVGEQGPELFTPGASGAITPNHALGGQTVQYNVTVAGGVTPEQMNMHLRQALKEYHPHAVQASVAAMRDSNARRPR